MAWLIRLFASRRLGARQVHPGSDVHCATYCPSSHCCILMVTFMATSRSVPPSVAGSNWCRGALPTSCASGGKAPSPAAGYPDMGAEEPVPAGPVVSASYTYYYTKSVVARMHIQVGDSPQSRPTPVCGGCGRCAGPASLYSYRPTSTRPGVGRAGGWSDFSTDWEDFVAPDERSSPFRGCVFIEPPPAAGHPPSWGAWISLLRGLQ